MCNYKRGDKHPNKDLIFWQYHRAFYKETNGEIWYTPEIFEEKKLKHSKSTIKYKSLHPLTYVVSGTIQRDKQKYKTNKSQLITLSFIEDLVIKQNNKCYWFNVDMELNSFNTTQIRNPLKLTIDRLDCNKGYSKDNVVLSCYAANCGRANCSTNNWTEIINKIKNGLITKSN